MSDFADIHPPNVVLVSSDHASPSSQTGIPAHCSPLSSAPNSPNNYVTDDEDDDDDEEVRPEEVQELLDIPASPSFLKIPTFREKRDVPFDEQKSFENSNGGKDDETENAFDRLLGNPRLQPKQSSTVTAAIVSPFKEDIDEYVEEDEEGEDHNDDDMSDEKKDDSSPTPPPRPNYSTYLSHRSLRRFSNDRVMTSTSNHSEEDSVPMDERSQLKAKNLVTQRVQQFEKASTLPTKNQGGDNNSDMQEHRPIQRRSTFSEPPPSQRTADPSSIKEALETAEQKVQEMERRVQAMIEQRRQTSQTRLSKEDNHKKCDKPPSPLNSSRETSSYYYDGSVMGSNRSNSEEINNTTLNTTTSSTAPLITSGNDNKMPTSDATQDYHCSKNDQGGKNSSFTAHFDNVVESTTQAFSQVTDDLASYVLGSPSRSITSDHQFAFSLFDSDTTPQKKNLSPTPANNTAGRNPEMHGDMFYRPSDKIARARSLVSGRQSSKQQVVLSPASRSNTERARQVILQRQRTGEEPASGGSRRETQSPEKFESDDGMTLPVPPTLHRIAAMIEGLAITDNDAAEEPSYIGNNHDWPTSVSEMMEEYQNAISESLRNLSMEDIANLADSPTKWHQFGKSAMASSEDPTAQQRSRDYDEVLAEVTVGGCLELPELDHLAGNPSSNKDYRQGMAGFLQYDDYQVEDPEDDERAVFAKQLSERLLNLDTDCSTDAGSSADRSMSKKVADRRSFFRSQHPQQSQGAEENQNNNDQEFSFDTNGSSFDMSPPKHRYSGAREAVADETSVLDSDRVKSGMTPSSEQPSFSSDILSSSNSRKEIGTAGETYSNAEAPMFTKPTMVENIDTEVGIAKGDAVLSLLCDNSFQATKEKPDSWTWRVREAIWRCRDMRRNFFNVGGGLGQPLEEDQKIPLRHISSLPVDVDDMRVVGGIKNVAGIQEKALTHLQKDEFEEALELYEDIIFNYYSFFEQVLGKKDEFSSQSVALELSNFKPYIGASLHNLGIIHLLKGDYADAFSFFKRAVENRRSCLGEDHADTITSLVRLSTCRFAMDNFADAHTNLELALSLAGSKVRTSKDYCQLSEILNNLGCLSYMCGQPTKAMRLFREALDVQLAVQNSTLYGGSKYAGHSVTLNISVVRGNIGFLALVLKDVSSGIIALESALRDQRLLLIGAHVTLVSTMDHLAVANLLEGRTQKALKMLRRIFELQKEAHGPNDPRCFATRQKIMTIRSQQARLPSKASQTTNGGSGSEKPAPQAPAEYAEPSHGHEDETKDSAGDGGGSFSARCAGDSGNSQQNTHGNKRNSLFKAIRSLGRKKNTQYGTCP